MAGGRPCKWKRPEIRERLCNALADGATWELAARCAGVSTSGLHKWKAAAQVEGADPDLVEFVDALKEAEAEGALRDLAIISRAADAGNWTAAAWRLERRHGYTKTERREVEVANVATLDDIEALEAEVAEGYALIEGVGDGEE